MGRASSTHASGIGGSIGGWGVNVGIAEAAGDVELENVEDMIAAVSCVGVAWVLSNRSAGAAAGSAAGSDEGVQTMAGLRAERLAEANGYLYSH